MDYKFRIDYKFLRRQRFSDKFDYRVQNHLHIENFKNVFK